MTTLELDAAQGIETVPFGKLRSAFRFGAALTEALAGEVNLLVKSFNALPPQDREMVYKAITAAYSGDSLDSGFNRLRGNQRLRHFGGPMAKVIFKAHFTQSAYRPDGDGGEILVKEIDLIAK